MRFLTQLQSNFRYPVVAQSRLFSSSILPEHVLNAAPTELSTVGNGLRVASESGHGEVACVGVWVDAGSRSETKANNGVAHFLEHMAFKGTGNRTQRSLEMEIENMGGHLNAFTSREQTVYYASVFKKDVPAAMDILSDILLNANYDESAIERERSVILRESDEVDKIPEEVLFDRLHETAFQGSGLSQTILGPKESIMNINRKDLVDYVNENYVAPKMVIAGAGAVEHSQLCELSEKFFSKVPASSQSSATETEKPEFIGSEIRVKNDDSPFANLAIAFEGPSAVSEDSIPLLVVQQLLGNWNRTSGLGANMSSRLCQEVAGKESAISLSSFSSLYKDTGLFGVHAVAEAHKLEELTWLIMENMVRMCHAVTSEEVELAKNNLKSGLVFNLDGCTSTCEEIGRQVLTYGRRMTTAEMFARIDAVGVEDIKAVAMKYINDQDLAMVADGPIHELPDYNYLRRRTYWLRA